MRKLSTFLLLLTTAAVPAFAQSAADEGDRRGRHPRSGEAAASASS